MRSCSSYFFLVFTLFVLIGCKPKFSQDDVSNIETQIRQEFSSREGVKVIEVNLVIESPRKLTGFAKLKTTFLDQTITVMKDCSAVLGEDSKIIWKCE